MTSRFLKPAIIAILWMALAPAGWAACRDAVVLVHGNTGSPADCATAIL